MKKFAIIGLGRFGERLARQLSHEDAEVIAIDRQPDLVERIRDQVTLAVCLDSTDEHALRAQAIDAVDAVIVSIGEEFESSCLTVATLKQIGVGRVIARAETEIQSRILRKLGADQIASPEYESAIRWAHRLTLPNLSDYVELGEGYSLIHISPPAKFCDKTLAELRLRNEFGVNLVAVSRKVTVQGSADAPSITQQAIIVPEADTTILPDDVLIILGSNEALGHLPSA